MKIYCLSIYNEHYKLFKELNLIPVSLGNKNYDDKWLNDKGIINISEKNINFGEYTFHYSLWKNQIKLNKYNDWIGFCTYRRFWIKKDVPNPKKIEELKDVILKEPDTTWKLNDVILVNPFIFKKGKNLKLIKRNFFEVCKKPSVLFKRTSIKDQFNIFHGSYFLRESVNLLGQNNRNDFLKFLDGYEYSPYNMFICKNSDILNQFYNEIFPWLFECEKIFKHKKLKGYDKIRIYGFLAERYMPYWFKKNFRTLSWPINFLDTHVLKENN